MQNYSNTVATTNLAGKLRMFSQRITLYTIASAQAPNLMTGQANTLSHAFLEVLKTLTKGGTLSGIEVLPLEPHYHPYIKNIQQAWANLERTRQSFLAQQGMNTGTLEKKHFLMDTHTANILAAGDHLLLHTEALVQELSNSASEKQKHLVSTLILFALFSVFLVVLGYYLIARYFIEPINRSVDQLNTTLKEESASLKQIQTMFQALANNRAFGVFILDNNLHLRYANQYIAELLGYSMAELNNRFPFKRLFDAQHYEIVKKEAIERIQKNSISTGSYQSPALRADGSTIELELHGTAFMFEGKSARIGWMLDISERKNMENAAKRASMVFNHASQAIVVTSAKAIIQDINPAFSAITGYHRDEAIGQSMNLLSSGKQPKAFYQAMWAQLLEAGHWHGDIRNRKKSGEEYVEHLSINACYNDDGSVLSYIGLFSDVTEKRSQELKIWHQAHYDHLTRLANRQMFYKNLENSIRHSKDTRTPFALVFIDLDLFKEVNDTFGHDEGDELLRLVAIRLKGCVRASDHIARLGGDEFTLIFNDLKQVDHIQPICEKILYSISQPYALGNNIDVTISASMGVAIYPRDADNSTELLKNADLAMYASKDKGRNQFSIFSGSMREAAQTRRNLLYDLHQALANNQFELHYQPIVNLQTQLPVKAEALLRWRHPEQGLISPASFIPLAEDSGLIIPLGNWVFHESIKTLAAWRKQYCSDFKIGINASAVQFSEGGIDVETWMSHLATLELNGSAIVIEITERLLMNTELEVDTRLIAFRDNQIQVALDDFGTGYSSLSYLKRYDIDYLKIDQSFIQNLKADSEDYVLCQAIVAMAHHLDILVIAEGIETLEQHKLVSEIGCDFGQGYWYARPMPHDTFTSYLKEKYSRL